MLLYQKIVYHSSVSFMHMFSLYPYKGVLQTITLKTIGVAETKPTVPGVKDKFSK